LYSSDGIAWSNGGFPLGTGAVISAAGYGGGQWVIGGANGTSNLATSSDGITWTLRNYNSAQNVFDVAWNGTLWIAVTNNGSNCIITSPDGATWTQRTLGISNSDGCRAVVWNGTHWYAIGMHLGATRVYRSTIGTSNWSLAATLPSGAPDAVRIGTRRLPPSAPPASSGGGGLPAFVTSDAVNNRLGINTTAPATALDVSGALTVRGAVFGRIPVTEVSGTSVTLASSNYNAAFYITNSGFNAATLPSATVTADAGSFWTLRNATSSSLSITLTNTLNLTSPLVIPPSNAQSLVVSGVTSNTILLM